MHGIGMLTNANQDVIRLISISHTFGCRSSQKPTLVVVYAMSPTPWPDGAIHREFSDHGQNDILDDLHCDQPVTVRSLLKILSYP